MGGWSPFSGSPGAPAPPCLEAKGAEPSTWWVSCIKLFELPICKIELLRGPIEVKLAGAQHTAWSPLCFLQSMLALSFLPRPLTSFFFGTFLFSLCLSWDWSSEKEAGVWVESQAPVVAFCLLIGSL